MSNVYVQKLKYFTDSMEVISYGIITSILNNASAIDCVRKEVVSFTSPLFTRYKAYFGRVNTKH